MKKITYIIAGAFLFLVSININAQIQMNKQECIIEYNLLKGDVQGKNFSEAKTRLDNMMNNCPKLTVNIYKLGINISEDMILKGDKPAGVALINKLYKQRIVNFPKGLGKVYNDWYTLQVKYSVSENESFQLLEKGYKTDPTALSAKNIYKYFDVILKQNKNKNVQKILDTYDDINDAREKKSGIYQQKLSKLIAKEEGGAILSKKEAKSKRIAEGTLKNLGIVGVGLNQKIQALLTCDRLIPLYRRDFDANRSNAQWLKRSVSRMFNKGCTEDPLYEELATAYAEADPSSNAYIFLSGILAKKGKITEAFAMREKAISLETNPIKKSKYLLAIAYELSKKGRKSQARKYANQALSYNPSNGSAYLLIATMYASSVNSCGNIEFSKRMVYVAALNKAKRAVTVDPSIASRARKYIKSYSSNIPTRAMAFQEGIKAGDSFKIKCWISENIRVQLK